MAVRFTSTNDEWSRVGFQPDVISVCGWYRKVGVGNVWGTLFSGGRLTTDMFDLQHNDFQTTVFLWVNPQGGDNSSANFTVADNTWYFMGLTIETNVGGGGTAYFYHAELGDPLTRTTLDLGTDVFSSGTWTFYQSESPWGGENINGRLADWKIWDSVLSFSEMRSEMNSIIPKTQNTWAWYPNFPGASERVKDYSGNGRDWTPNGTLADEDPPPVSWGASVVTEQLDTKARSMSVDIGGLGQMLRRTEDLPSSILFTMCGWCKLNQIRAAEWQFWGLENTVYPAQASGYRLLGFDQGGDFWLSTSGGGGAIFDSFPSADTWFFWAITGVGNSAGDVIGYWAYSGSPFEIKAASNVGAFTSAQITIGTDTWDEYMDARWANIKIYDAVLTEAELYKEMYSFRPQRTADLHLWTPFFGPNIAKDMSGNNRHWQVLD